jgi:prepilin-type processing-associated H-X9-DG protein
MEGAKNGRSYPDMKLQTQNRRKRAMTILDVLVVLVCILILAIILLPMLSTAKRRGGPNCASNLKQISLAFQIWAADNNNKYPMSVSVTNGGAMELIETGNLVACLQLVSNEMSTTKILVCPADPERTFATNFDVLDSSNVSYFVGADASNDADPNMVLDGDDNLVIGGMPVKSGMLDLRSNAPVFWSEARHVRVGNIGFADGSVLETATKGLQQAFQKTGLTTNRIVIP